jgi:MarR family transcriptional regulator, organic hydroperoxide resistance regulator
MKNDHILFTIGRINYKVNRFLVKELKKQNLGEISPSHGEIIGSLLLRGSLQMKEIAEIIDKDKSTITSLVNKLISLDYVEKKKDVTDNRISNVSLTAKGKALKPIFVEISEKLETKAFQGISEQEREILNILLAKLNNSM